MHTKGITALGHAVLTSVAMASKGAPGSQVIILTDGVANQGIGSFGHHSKSFLEKFIGPDGRLNEEKVKANR